MHDKPCSARPKSAGPGRMESDSSTERDHHHHHRSRPRSRARFGNNPKHRYDGPLARPQPSSSCRAHSYTGPRRGPPAHDLPPHNDLHVRGHSPPCRDTDPVTPCPPTHRGPPPHPATPHHLPPTPQHCPPTPHRPPTSHHAPLAQHPPPPPFRPARAPVCGSYPRHPDPLRYDNLHSLKHYRSDLYCAR